MDTQKKPGQQEQPEQQPEQQPEKQKPMPSRGDWDKGDDDNRQGD